MKKNHSSTCLRERLGRQLPAPLLPFELKTHNVQIASPLSFTPRPRKIAAILVYYKPMEVFVNHESDVSSVKGDSRHRARGLL